MSTPFLFLKYKQYSILQYHPTLNGYKPLQTYQKNDSFAEHLDSPPPTPLSVPSNHAQNKGDMALKHQTLAFPVNTPLLQLRHIAKGTRLAVRD